MAADVSTTVEVDDRGVLVVVKRAATPAGLVLVLHELDMLGAAQHPGVVELLDGTDRSGSPAVTTRWVGPRTLAGLQGDDLSGRSAALAATAHVVADLHDAGLVHGALTAEHVVLAAGGRPVLCSFGRAAWAGAAEGPSPADDVAGLGHMLRAVLGAADDGPVGPERRSWRRRAAWPGASRRALLDLAQQATADHGPPRPSARAIATGINALLPEARLVPTDDEKPDTGSFKRSRPGDWSPPPGGAPAVRWSPHLRSEPEAPDGRATDGEEPTAPPFAPEAVDGAATHRVHAAEWQREAGDEPSADGGRSAAGNEPGALDRDRPAPATGPAGSASGNEPGALDRRATGPAAGDEPADDVSVSCHRPRPDDTEPADDGGRRDQPDATDGSLPRTPSTAPERVDSGPGPGRRLEERPADAGGDHLHANGTAAAGVAAVDAAEAVPPAGPAGPAPGDRPPGRRREPPPISFRDAATVSEAPVTIAAPRAAEAGAPGREEPARAADDERWRSTRGRSPGRTLVVAACVATLLVVCVASVGRVVTRRSRGSSPRPPAAGTVRSPASAPVPTATAGTAVGQEPPSTSAGDSPPMPGCDAAAGTRYDVDGDGCADAVVLEAGTVTAAGTRYAVGRPGDRVTIGDWDCDGRATPAVVRPATGEVFVFATWAVAGGPVTVRPTGVVPDAVDFLPAPAEDARRCGRLVVRTRGGEVVVPTVAEP